MPQSRLGLAQRAPRRRVSGAPSPCCGPPGTPRAPQRLPGCRTPPPPLPPPPRRLGHAMEGDNRTATWHRGLHVLLRALNQTLPGTAGCGLECPASHGTAAAARPGRPGRNDNAYMYILFVMTLFAATVGSLILGYTRSRKVDKRSDPYHVYIKNRVSMI